MIRMNDLGMGFSKQGLRSENAAQYFYSGSICESTFIKQIPATSAWPPKMVVSEDL